MTKQIAAMEDKIKQLEAQQAEVLKQVNPRLQHVQTADMELERAADMCSMICNYTLTWRSED